MLKKTLGEIQHFLSADVTSHARLSLATCDSRKVERGALFFALKGQRSDGHSFLKEVASKGAAAAVVSKSYSGLDYGLLLIRVRSVFETLHTLARWFHQQSPPYLLAVTGTVGKTTTKEYIAKLLEQRGKVERSPGSVNSQIGLPLFLLNRKDPVDKLVLEMGMSFPGEISKLVHIAPPDFGVLTKVSMVHTENFKDICEIARAKMELFEKVKRGLFNLETIHFSPVKRASLHKTFYSVNDRRADYFLEKGQKGVTIFERGVASPPLNLPIQASHLLEDFLCAASVARMHGLGWDEIQRGTLNIETCAHRFHLFERDGIHYVDDSYNASVASFKAALDNLPKGKRVIALIGEMRELGLFSVECHEEVARHALDIVDHLLCMGNGTDPIFDLFKREGKRVEKVTSLEQAKKRIQSIQRVGDVVFIKGSNSLKLWSVLDA